MEHVNPRPTQSYNISPQNLLVVPYVRITGGKTTLRNEVARNETETGVTYHRDVVIHVANELERKKAENFATRVRNFARGHARFTPLGYVAKLDARAQLEAAALELEQEAAALNAELTTCKVLCYVVLLQFGVELNSDVARALNDNVYSQLQALKTAVETRAPTAKSLYNDARGILKLVSGVSADAVAMALEEVKGALKAQSGVPSLPHLENAISFFAPTTDSEFTFEAL